MAMRPYDGGAAHRGARSEPRARAAPSGQMMPFDEGLFSGGLFGGRDPFKEFGAMDFFGGGRGGHGDVTKRFDQMTNDMFSGFGGMGGASGTMTPGNGQYACQSFAMVSKTGADGKVHTERYSSSDVGNRAQQIRESQQMYSNSSSGMDKMGLERQLGDRARKMVRERDRGTKEERSTEMLRGMEESGRSAFDRDFHGKAHHLPPHAKGAAMLAPGAMGGRALPGSSRGPPQGQLQPRHQSVPSRRR